MPDTTKHELEIKRSTLMDRLYKVRRDRQRADQPLSADFAEQAVQRENDDVLEQLEASITKELHDIGEALERMSAGKYGVCESCGKPIGTGRMAARPYATRCTPCAEREESAALPG